MPVATDLAAPKRGVALEAVPMRHPWRWVAAGVVVLLVLTILESLWTNPNLDRSVIGEYLFAGVTLRGVVVTLYLTAAAMLIGIVGGTLIAVMRLSENPVLSTVATGYVWVFRGTPVLVQIIFWGYLGALYPELGIGIPFTEVVFASTETSAVIGGTLAAVLALGLNEVAYASEIVRAGILSVDEGQTEAARALGMSSSLTTRRVVLPQAMRVIIPPMGNETITMLKTTALVSVISGADLLTNLQDVYAQTFEVIPLLVVASIWYLAITSVLSLGQAALERHYGRGAATRGGVKWRERMRLRARTPE